MAIEVKQLRGTSAQIGAYTGPVGVITVNTDTNALAVHDGVTPGGHTPAAIPPDGTYGDIIVSGSGGTWTIDDESVTYAKLQQISDTDLILGRASSGAGAVEEIPCAPVARNLLAAVDAAAQRAVLALGTLATQSAGSVAITGGSITGIVSPSGSSDAVTKSYVDALVNGLKWKQSVVAATTAAVTLATDLENGDTLDGVTLSTGDRILVKNQASGAENGIYVVAASGAPARSSDADSGTELISAAVSVQGGTTNADKVFGCTNDSITLGVTSIVFTNVISTNGALLGANNLSDLLNAGTARSNLQLVIGTDVEAHHANLTSLAGITGAADLGVMFSGVGTLTTFTVTSFARTLLDDTSAANFKSTLSLNNVENTALSTWAGTSSITTLGTITTGTWNGTLISVAKGGTGSDLSATGGAMKFLLQSSTGGAVTPTEIPAEDVGKYGDGSDGDVTISGNTTLTREMFYHDLTINSSIVLTTAGYPIHCSGTLTVNGTISRKGTAGSNASGSTLGAAGGALSATDTGGSGAGSNGATGPTGTGGASGAVSGTSASASGANGGQGGAGGAGTSGAGGSAANGGVATAKYKRAVVDNWISGTTILNGGAGGKGGASGAGDGSNTGGGGGGGGSGGGLLPIYARIIVVGASGAISADGGAGGNGGTPAAGNCGGGGAGGGGGGGLVFLMYNSLTVTAGGTITADKGAQGTPGNGVGTGTAGTAGSAASNGIVLKFDALNRTWN